MKKQEPYKDLLKIRDADQAFDMLCCFMYFAGKFDANMPVDESREVFKHIKKLLNK